MSVLPLRELILLNSFQPPNHFSSILSLIVESYNDYATIIMEYTML